MVLAESVSLAKFGFNPHEKLTSSDNFSRQLESYALHVIEDRPVSNCFSYFVDRDQVYVDREMKTKLHIDIEERNGMATYGTYKAIDSALANPGKAVLFYSPPGPVAFGTGTKYEDIKPYADGQLYVLSGKPNNTEVEVIAVSVSKENEQRTLSEFMGNENVVKGFDDEIERIKYHLANPIVSGLDIDGIIHRLEVSSQRDDYNIYTNVHGEVFRLSDVGYDLRRGFLGGIRPKIKMDYRSLYMTAFEKGAGGAYQEQLNSYFALYSQDGRMVLGGSCGGDGLTKGDLISKVELKPLNPLSTDYRLATPTLKELLKKKEDRYDDYTCPNCGINHKGEIKGSDPATWLTQCGCGFQFRCAV